MCHAGGRPLPFPDTGIALRGRGLPEIRAKGQETTSYYVSRVRAVLNALIWAAAGFEEA
jgi:hypothetical protein